MRASDRSLESVAYRWGDVDEHHKRKRLQISEGRGEEGVWRKITTVPGQDDLVSPRGAKMWWSRVTGGLGGKVGHRLDTAPSRRKSPAVCRVREP